MPISAAICLPVQRRRRSSATISIFLALATWMWGIVGAIIGVPVLVVLKVFSGDFPNLAGLAEFLSVERVSADNTEPEDGVHLNASRTFSPNSLQRGVTGSTFRSADM